MSSDLYPCPCCGYLVHEDGPGSFEICRICRWEDDPGQLRNPWLAGGANKPSLIDAQRMFEELGVSSQSRLERATLPRDSDIRESNWRPFDPDQDWPPGRDMSGEPWPQDRTVLYWWRPTYWRRAK